MKTIKISEIKINDSFLNSEPSEEKVNKYRTQFTNSGKQSKYVILDKNNYLIDGYIQYLILKENGIEDVEFLYNQKNSYKNRPTTYIYGKHLNSKCDKEFVWRLSKNQNVSIGDKAYCQTKFGIAPIIVTKIEVLDRCPVDFKVKKVVSV